VLFGDDIADHADFDNPTLPPSGVSHVFVNGSGVIADGRPTGRRPGRVL
jgi:N-acyl-D-amino-acid deacylase